MNCTLFYGIIKNNLFIDYNKHLFIDDEPSYDTYIEKKMIALNNNMNKLTQQQDKHMFIYHNLINKNKFIQLKINAYKNILHVKHIHNNSAITFITLHYTHINALLNNQIISFNANCKKINKIVDKIDCCNRIIDKIRFKISFI